MRAASFRWPRAPTIRRCSGSIRKSAASFRSTRSMCRHGLRAPCARRASPSSCDRDFSAVIEGCAEPGPKRARTWINAPIRKLYRGLFEIGHCHTVEVYDGDALVGGLYGVSLGRAFFGESMFHRARDASKIALVHLVARLRAGGYRAARHPVPHRSPEDVRRDRGAAGALRQAARAGRSARKPTCRCSGAR